MLIVDPQYLPVEITINNMKKKDKKVSKLKNESTHSTVILLSGGLDSATCLYLAKESYDKIYTISFDYGQKHKSELKFAKKLAKLVGTEHYQAKIQTGLFQGSSLIDKDLSIPKDKLKHHNKKNTIPNTYVPGRNILFLSYALSFAESRGCESIFIGVNALDYSGYPDCRPDFIKSFQNMIKKGTKAGVEGRPIQLVTPLLNLTKRQIIEVGNHLDVPYHLTTSCYDPDPKTGESCHHCDACLLREAAFSEIEKEISKKVQSK